MLSTSPFGKAGWSRVPAVGECGRGTYRRAAGTVLCGQQIIRAHDGAGLNESLGWTARSGDELAPLRAAAQPRIREDLGRRLSRALLDLGAPVDATGPGLDFP
jgi:hypothetical protein